MIYLLFGPPAAGKSTQGNLLSQAIGVPYIGIGSLLWKKSQSEPTLLKQLNQGQLLSPTVVTDVLTHLAEQHPHAVILDGAIRLPEQVDRVASLWPNEKIVGLEIDLPNAVIHERTQGRTADDGKNRPCDDEPAIVEKRIATYRANHAGVMAQLDAHHIPHIMVNGDQTIQAIQTELQHKLKKLAA